MMAYFMVNGVDFSNIVSSLVVDKEANYNAQTAASGKTVVDYINSKRVIEVGIIPLTPAKMETLKSELNKNNIKVDISFLNPDINGIETITCILPSISREYYTIQENKVLFKPFELTFEEL